MKIKGIEINCRAAFRAALRPVGVAFGLEKLLVFSAESKGCSAIGTLDRLVLKNNWMTSSLYNQLEFGPSNT